MQEPGDPSFDWLDPKLAVGGCVPAAVICEMAREAGVRLVIDLRQEACDDAAALGAAGVELLHLPTPDRAAVSPAHLEAGVRRLALARARGEGALVHCHHGIGRSALLVLCALDDQGMAPLEALSLLKSVRSRVSPSPEQYWAWADWLRARGAEPLDFATFAEAAYGQRRA